MAWQIDPRVPTSPYPDQQQYSDDRIILSIDQTNIPKQETKKPKQLNEGETEMPESSGANHEDDRMVINAV